MAVKPGPPPFDPSKKQPVLQGAQDTDPYVGKPKPPVKPPQRPVYGSSDGSGFDFAKWQAGQHRPRPTQILPGQGQGPMPVGTKPLPNPVVKDARGDLGGGNPWDGRYGPVGPSGEGPDAPWRHPEWFPKPPSKQFPNGQPASDPRYFGGGMTRGGDIGFGEDPNKRYGGGGGQPPWLEGQMLPMDIGPGSANERAQASLKAQWEAKNGPWQGGGQMGDSGFGQDPNKSYPMPFDPKSAMRELGGRGLQQQGGYPSGGDMWEQDRWRQQRTNETGMTTGLWSPADQARSEGRSGPYDNPGGGMRAMGDDLKGLQGQAGFGGGMQGQGGLRDNNAGRLSQQAIATGLMDDRGYPGGNMKPGGMGPGGQDPMYGGAGQGPSYGGGPKGMPDVNYGAPVAVSGGKPQYANPYTSERQYGAPGAPPAGTGPGSMGKPQQPGMPSREGGASHRGGQRPPQGRPPVNPQQMQQGAQELYNDNTIPHEFKGQLLQAAQSGDPQAFNDMLFNSNIPHATKLKLQQMFGYGGGGGAPTQSAQPDQGQQQQGPWDEAINGVSQAYNGGKGSPYYGAF